MGQNINLKAEFDSTRFDQCQIVLWRSKVRTKFGWWTNFPYKKGYGEYAEQSSIFLDRGQDFTAMYKMRARGSAKRRYQFQVGVSADGGSYTFFTVWIPSTTGYTQDSTIDLGNIDQYF